MELLSTCVQKYIKLPMTEDNVNEQVSGFFSAFAVPQCVDVIDGTHIDIKQPADNSTDHINRKHRYSLNI